MNLPRTMRALQLRAVGQLREVELPVPSPKPGELLIATAATTICTSDLIDILHNPFGTKLPRVLGHEGAGVVAALGEGVTGFRVGDRVTAHPVIPCGQCESCKRGLGHLCDSMGHLALDRDGTFAEYFCHPERRARHIPAGVDAAVAALVEPVAVCLEAVRRARLSPGETALIVGDGPFGIIITRLAMRCRPGKVILVGRHDFRLNQAPEATAINEKKAPDVAGAVAQASDGKGVDAAILAVASPEGMNLCLQSLRPRGRAVVFAGMVAPVPIDLFRLHVKELEILGACNDEGYLDEALSCLCDPDLRLDSIITHRIPFRDWERAVALAAGGKDEALKVAMVFGQEAAA